MVIIMMTTVSFDHYSFESKLFGLFCFYKNSKPFLKNLQNLFLDLQISPELGSIINELILRWKIIATWKFWPIPSTIARKNQVKKGRYHEGSNSDP